MKKIYYFPGLISAIIIPLLFWYYGNQKFEEINLNIIDIGIPSKIKPGDEINSVNTFESLRSWDYKKIKVPSNKAKENSNLYVSEIKKLKERNQQNTGIEFVLDDHNTYGDFISLLNDLHITKREEYTLDLEKTGHLFVIQRYIPPIVEECLLCNDTIDTFVDSDSENNWAAYVNFIEPKGYTKFMNVLTQLPKEAFFIIFGFLLLLHISMLSIKENLRIQRKIVA
jgi:hypothetical protein